MEVGYEKVSPFLRRRFREHAGATVLEVSQLLTTVGIGEELWGIWEVMGRFKDKDSAIRWHNEALIGAGV